MNRLASLLLSAFAVASSVAAQAPIVLRGQVTDGSAAGCYYCPGYSHVVKFSGTQLASPSINLLAYHNLMCKITGTWNGTVVEVSAIEVVDDSFSIGGNGHVGGQLKFTALGSQGDVAINAFALGAACSIPFFDCGLLLQPSSLAILGMGTMGSSGEAGTNIDVPDVPALTGLRVFGQALIMKADGSVLMSNVDAREIG
ncbi:MAG: hypothetical protein JNK78_07690 [Planctomycetes bacterium]|nr:hypothetical protein [Planctomycetota bacterium]